jgi:hypothetical protein
MHASGPFPEEDQMATKTKTVTTDPQQVDVDGDGDIDAVVSHSATITIMEEEGGAPDPQNGPGPEPRGTVAGDCGSTPCAGSLRKRLTFTQSNVAKVFTFTPTNYVGAIFWEFGDGTTATATGPVQHTYATAGAKNVYGTPLASSARMRSLVVVATVP